MIEYYKKLAKKEELKRLKDYSKNCWVNVVDPSEKEIKFLIEKFDLDMDLVLDGLDVYEMPRIEEEEGKAYLYFRTPTSKIQNEYTSSFLIIISEEIFITVSKSGLELFEKILNSKKDFLTNKRTRLLLHVLLSLSGKYNSKISNILKLQS